ncbi:MAG TPA: hypothetical protein PK989_09650 [Anaerolineales bacterium]|nr:hypothetical protein [Anaerolineales bacterium]
MKIFDRILSTFSAKGTAPYPELKKLLSGYNSQRAAPEILYLGDSVVERVSWGDKDKRTLDVMVADRLRNQKRLLCVSHSAYHLKVYYYLLKVLSCTHQKPDLVILPLNIRSFAPQWDLNPNWQFNEEIAALEEFLKDPSRIPVISQNKEVIPFTEQEKGMGLDFPFTHLKRFGEFQEIINSNPTSDEEKTFRKKQIFIFHYLHPLSDSHPKLMFFPRIIGLCRELNIRLFIYVTPVNYQGGQRYVGKAFADLLSANVNVVRQKMETNLDQALHFLDLSLALPSEAFFHADEASEHLNQYGRAQLTEILANEVVSMGTNVKVGVAPL